mmetsp:Transcript_7323/g.13219  ORF Transcript_7323/g.13219 Transcript_7323/m.13219 type:complete len:242 (-) Transcript_7323:43-768(-)
MDGSILYSGSNHASTVCATVSTCSRRLQNHVCDSLWLHPLIIIECIALSWSWSTLPAIQTIRSSRSIPIGKHQSEINWFSITTQCKNHILLGICIDSFVDFRPGFSRNLIDCTDLHVDWNDTLLFLFEPTVAFQTEIIVSSINRHDWKHTFVSVCVWKSVRNGIICSACRIPHKRAEWKHFWRRRHSDEDSWTSDCFVCNSNLFSPRIDQESCFGSVWHDHHCIDCLALWHCFVVSCVWSS